MYVWVVYRLRFPYLCECVCVCGRWRGLRVVRLGPAAPDGGRLALRRFPFWVRRGVVSKSGR